uniref:Putative GTPase activating protein of Rab-like GTPase n=1 Tax=Trypanosoma congolense (strain IL3000) TaxID=1068625 RepID=G0UJ38_TRYCI|nr:putative GTPase activating protein of Rab-like GTPase [Trypanosoma congolense IL3000]
MESSPGKEASDGELSAVGGKVRSPCSSLDEISSPQECRTSCIERGMADNRIRALAWIRISLGMEEGVKREKSATAANGKSRATTGRGGDSRNQSDGTLKMRRTAVSAADEPSSEMTQKGGEEKKHEKDESKSSGPSVKEWGSDLPENCQTRVILADVLRSLWSLYPDEDQRESKRKLLCDILVQMLSKNVERYYYQGLHEMVGFIMYVMEEWDMETIAAVCARLLVQQWHSFSCKELSRSQSMMYAVHAVVAAEDSALATALESCSVGPETHYAMPWLITWYTHVCDDFTALGRLFDFLIANDDENTVIFFTVALMLKKRDRIMAIIRAAKRTGGNALDADYTASGPHEDEESETDVEANNPTVMAIVYTELVRLPKEVLRSDNAQGIEDIIEHSQNLKKKYPDHISHVRETFMRGTVPDAGTPASWWRRWKWGKFPWGKSTPPTLRLIVIGFIGVLCLRGFLSGYFSSRFMRELCASVYDFFLSRFAIQ